MPDIVDRETRSRMMSGIRGKDTKPEMTVRRYLFGKGFRYRLHVAGLPGKPDLVLPRHRAVVFVHGCFWHRHAGCSLFKLPGTRTEFWEQKISRNVMNDRLAMDRLREQGWRIAVVWECGLRKKMFAETGLLPQLETWISGSEPFIELGLAGTAAGAAPAGGT